MGHKKQSLSRTMKRLLPLLIFLNNFLAFASASVAQCGYLATLGTTKDYCTGSSLIARSPHSLETIVWYKDGQALSTVKATQSLDTNTVLVAGGNGTGPNSNQVSPSAIAVDEQDNLYILDGPNNRVQKWAPGASIGYTVAGGNGAGSAPNQLNQPSAMFVTAQNNLYILDDLNNRVQEWTPGAASGTTVLSGTPSVGVAGDWNLYVDCLGNIYNLYRPGESIVRYAPGSATPVTVAGGNGTGNGPNQFYDPYSFWLDGKGNIFVNDGVNGRIQEWKAGATTGVTVAGGHGWGVADNQVNQGFLWVDGMDTIYFSDGYWNNFHGRIQKWAPGATSGVTLSTTTGNYITGVANNYGSIVMDVHGNLFVASNASVLELKRSSYIDSSYTPTAPGRYWAVVTDMQGYSQTTDTVVINDPGLGAATISITASATSTPVCTPITFTAQSVNGGVDPSYQWQVSGVDAGGDSVSYSYNLFANGDRVYCIMTTQLGCTSQTITDTSNIITLDISPYGTSSVAIDATGTSVCKGDSVDFTATITDGVGVPVFQWLINGNPITGDDSPVYASDSLTNGDVITCLINSNNICGHAKSNSIAEIVNIPPVIAPGQLFTIPYGQSLTLEPVVTGDVSTWSWTPPAGLSDPGIQGPVADPSANTLYTLKVTSPAGCVDSATILVNVYTPLSIPNAFTPNGDGRNDKFYVLGGPVNSVVAEFAVYDRWGQMLFQVHNAAPGDAGAGWDGRIHGSPAPSGAYAYVVVMKYAGGVVQTYKGAVMLIR